MRHFYFLLSILFSFSTFEIQAQQSKTDSLTTLLPTLSENKDRVEVLHQLMLSHIRSDKTKAAAYGQEGLELGKRIGYQLGTATLHKDLGVLHIMSFQYDSTWHYYQLAKEGFGSLLNSSKADQKKLAEKGYAGTIGNIGTWFYYQSEPDSAIYYHRKAIELSTQFDLPNVKANSLNLLGILYINRGYYDLALKNYLEALKNFESMDNIEGISRIYQEIGNIHLRYKEEPQKALYYYKKSLVIKKEINSSSGLAWALNFCGNAFMFLEKYDSSAYYINKSLEIAREQKIKRLIVDNYSILNVIDRKKDVPTQAAISRSLEMKQIAKEINYPEGEYTGYSNMGWVYTKSGKYSKAIQSYEKSIELAKEQDDILNLELYYSRLYNIYTNGKKDPIKALSALENQFLYKDSLRSLDRTRQIEQLSIQYETEQKEKEIAILEKDNALAAVEIQLRKNQTLTIALGALGLLLLVVFLYYRFRYIRKINEELDRLNATKDRLFAIISHDLRGAVSAFQNIGQIISFHLKKGNYERLERVASQVDKSANNLNNLLDNLLQWSVSQIEGVELKPTRLYISKSVEEIVELFEENAAAKGIQLQSFIGMDLQAIADENSLHLVLRNLVSNAIKFTSEGDKIEIHAKENDHFVELNISDTGTGIPEEKMARIFQIDSKTSSKGTSGERGTGLGLALCKEFVERNGGSIELQSTFGEGTVCRFRLPKAV